MHEASVANRSPTDEDGDVGEFVVDHFAELESGDGVGFGLVTEGDAHDELVGAEGDGCGRGELGVVDGWDGVAPRPASDGDGSGVGLAGILPGREDRHGDGRFS